MALSFLLGAVGGGRAAAFLDPAGQGEAIVTTSFSDSANAFDASGHLVPVASYRKFELTTYLDYGLTDWLTLIAAPSADDIISSGNPAHAYRGLGLSEAGARAEIASWDQLVFSAQATGLAPGSFDKSNPALAGNNSFETDGRFLVGTSFDLWGMSGFVDLEAGYRWFAIGPGEVRLDATLGLRPVAKLMLLAQSFNIWSIGPGVAYAPNMREDKLQASAVYDFAKSWSAQLGGFATIAAINARRERGLITAIWYRF